MYPVETLKRMLMPGKKFRTRPTGEYDTASLRTPYRFISLMLNRIFGRAHGKSFKLEWVPIIFCVATRGTIFNWAILCLIASGPTWHQPWEGCPKRDQSSTWAPYWLIAYYAINPSPTWGASGIRKEHWSTQRTSHCGLTSIIAIIGKCVSTSLCHYIP